MGQLISRVDKLDDAGFLRWKPVLEMFYTTKRLHLRWDERFGQVEFDSGKVNDVYVIYVRGDHVSPIK